MTTTDAHEPNQSSSSREEYDYDRWVSINGDASAYDAAERLASSRYNSERESISLRVFTRNGARTTPRWVVPTTQVDESGQQVRGISLVTGNHLPARFLSNDDVHCVDVRYLD